VIYVAALGFQRRSAEFIFDVTGCGFGLMMAKCCFPPIASKRHFVGYELVRFTTEKAINRSHLIQDEDANNER